MSRFGEQVRGRCPACGLAALFLGSGGYVTCGNLPCPDPTSANALLERAGPPAIPEFDQSLVDNLIEIVAGYTGDDGTNSMGVTVELARAKNREAAALERIAAHMESDPESGAK